MMANNNDDNNHQHRTLPHVTASAPSASPQTNKRSAAKRNRNAPKSPSAASAAAAASGKSQATPGVQQHRQKTDQLGRPHQSGSGSHLVTKRPTAKLSQRPNDIYVSNKSDFRAQLKQCNSLLSSSDFHEVYLHSIGAAVSRAINLALTLVAESQGGLGYEANTSTIVLTDNLHPLHDDADFSVSQRRNGCLHVRVYRHCRDVLLLDETGPATPVAQQ